MPVIRNYCHKPVIELELNLCDGEGFIYDKNQKDYLNWIPYKFRITDGKNEYELDEMSFSLEGLKCFLNKIDMALNERNITTEYKRIEYCGSENEFEIVFQNVDDYYEDLIIETEVWVNAACLPIQQPGYSIGYQFIIRLKDLEKFSEDLKEQLKKLLES